MKKNMTIVMIGLFLTNLAMGVSVLDHQDRNESEYNQQYTKVIDGYDPVSFFIEQENNPTQGLLVFEETFGQREYLFSSKANQDTFKSDPLKFEPTYGSWCAWAMSNGSKAPIIPEAYTVHRGRLHFFASFGAKARFDENKDSREKLADENWFLISGEMPR